MHIFLVDEEIAVTITLSLQTQNAIKPYREAKDYSAIKALTALASRYYGAVVYTYLDIIMVHTYRHVHSSNTFDLRSHCILT